MVNRLTDAQFHTVQKGNSAWATKSLSVPLPTNRIMALCHNKGEKPSSNVACSYTLSAQIIAKRLSCLQIAADIILCCLRVSISVFFPRNCHEYGDQHIVHLTNKYLQMQQNHNPNPNQIHNYINK